MIDSKQWTGSVHQSPDGLAWHNHYRLDRTLETVRWEADTIGRILGTRAAAVVCVHGAHVHGGGLGAHGVAIVPAGWLRDALGQDRALSDAEVERLAAAAHMRLRPPDACRVAVRLSHVGEATRLGLDTPRRPRPRRHLGGLSASSEGTSD